MAQAEQSWKNVGAIFEAAGTGLENVVKTTDFWRTWTISPLLTRFYALTLSRNPLAAAWLCENAAERVLCEIRTIAEL
jgi:enamine deaminase RidA (YjgF/YER057c/UK114 family)